ncbi:hypothetical protein SAMN05216326_10880 [Nitrosomonas marina]|uniref:Uncharacterized protein n=1 Tax=Nitrosomonas marina TaxID=917 RepID=A0A1I0AUR1_9PROT|nr:hypothetical protein SAMN05216326_10880 [Nitrosomonas marina]
MFSCFQLNLNDVLYMQYQLLTSVAFSTEKTGNLDTLERIHFGDHFGSLAQRYRLQFTLYLSSHICFPSTRLMLYDKINHR